MLLDHSSPSVALPPCWDLLSPELLGGIHTTDFLFILSWSFLLESMWCKSLHSILKNLHIIMSKYRLLPKEVLAKYAVQFGLFILKPQHCTWSFGNSLHSHYHLGLTAPCNSATKTRKRLQFFSSSCYSDKLGMRLRQEMIFLAASFNYKIINIFQGNVVRISQWSFSFTVSMKGKTVNHWYIFPR